MYIKKDWLSFLIQKDSQSNKHPLINPNFQNKTNLWMFIEYPFLTKEILFVCYAKLPLYT